MQTATFVVSSTIKIQERNRYQDGGIIYVKQSEDSKRQREKNKKTERTFFLERKSERIV